VFPLFKILAGRNMEGLKREQTAAGIAEVLAALLVNISTGNFSMDPNSIYNSNLQDFRKLGLGFQGVKYGRLAWAKTYIDYADTIRTSMEVANFFSRGKF
jgi:hypothetical protein